MNLNRATAALIEDLRPLRFEPPVTHVYNPLEYAGKSYKQYLKLYGGRPKEVILVGMNPGPWGMAQTGIPFGEVNSVRDWMGIEAPVGSPPAIHPKRPVQGFRLRTKRSQRQAPLGLGRKGLRHTRKVLLPVLRGQLLPADLLRRKRKEPHARQPPCGRKEAPPRRL